MENRPAPQGPEGCLTVAIRVPVRIVVLVLVVPVRMAWDLLAAGAKTVRRVVLAPLWHALIVIPSRWLYAWVLTPLGRATAWLGRAVGAGIWWLAQVLLVWPCVALWRWVVVPLWTYALVVPAVWLYAWVLTPVGRAVAWLAQGVGTLLAPLGRAVAVVVREIRDAIGHAWRAAGFVSRAVGRGLTWLGWNLVGRPVRWAYVVLLTPVGHWVRDAVLRPAKKAALAAGRTARQALASARETVRAARRDAWRALIGGPSREQGEHGARTLGSTTTASGAVPAPEISLSKTEG
uniref:Integral membrane protein n=1 Tax=Streptomyces sp. NBC_00003 TaxID=2903608 RepID=A0AAU2V997_9ACTN